MTDLGFRYWDLGGCHFECSAEGGMYREVVFIQLLAVSLWLLAFYGFGIWAAVISNAYEKFRL